MLVRMRSLCYCRSIINYHFVFNITFVSSTIISEPHNRPHDKSDDEQPTHRHLRRSSCSCPTIDLCVPEQQNTLLYTNYANFHPRMY